MIAYQSLLFVPGTRPERFEKALASGADIVAIDLEDSVGFADKESARTAAIAAIGDPRLGIRINGLRTATGLADLIAINAAAKRPPFVMVPMVESTAEIEIIHAVLGKDVAIIPLVETVAGVRQADAIAAQPGLGGLMLGGADLSGELGVSMSWDALYSARAHIVMACARAKIPSIDVPYLDLDNLDALAIDVARVAAMGFSAKALVHPKHVNVVHSIMRPTADQIAEALEAKDAYAAAGENAVRFKNTMLEEPVMMRYRRILELAGSFKP